jgi:formamidopyrimidine-DNA glycosylase
MIELPEAIVVARQIQETLSGKRIASAVAGQSPHKFAWYSGDPAEYNARLAGKVVGQTRSVGGTIMFAAGDMEVAVGAPIRYHVAGEARPKKHQLLIVFEDDSAISSSAQMWGEFRCYPLGGSDGFHGAATAQAKPTPLSDAFDRAYFDGLWPPEAEKVSAKAFLATEQRIPGLGNGVLQDILWVARINPRRKLTTLNAAELEELFTAVKGVLADMTAKGGRDTERDLFWQPGGYRTILSANTAGTPCPACGAIIVKEAYLGGSVYYCPICQPWP